MIKTFKSCKRNYSKPTNISTTGNLAIKTNSIQLTEYETPKIMKFVIGKKENKIFCGCWQVANQEEAC